MTLNLRYSKLMLEGRKLSLRTRLATLSPSLLLMPIATQSLFIGTGPAAGASWLCTQGPCLWCFVLCAVSLTLLALHVALIRVVLLQVAVATDFVLWLRNARLPRDQSLLQLVFHPQVRGRCCDQGHQQHCQLGLGSRERRDTTLLQVFLLPHLLALPFPAPSPRISKAVSEDKVQTPHRLYKVTISQQGSISQPKRS